MKGLFYQPVKVEAKNHQILFWGCLHYGHNPKWDVPIWRRRGFNSSEEHDEGIIRNWNSRATDKTVGFLLGDIMFGYGGEEKFNKLMSRLNFSRVFVMSGNHVAGWHQAFQSVDSNTLYVDGNHSKEVIERFSFIEEENSLIIKILVVIFFMLNFKFTLFEFGKSLKIHSK